jgi:hypothetical protein
MSPGMDNPNSARAVIADAINVKALTDLADSIANDGMQALLRVMNKRELPGVFRDDEIRAKYRKMILDNIMAHARELLDQVDKK